MNLFRLAIVPLALGLALAGPFRWVEQESGTKARLRGVSVVDAEVAWASGASGTILRTTDGGTTWTPRPVPGGDARDFRDLHAEDASVAYALAIGEGEKSRIYRTGDGGASWSLQHTNRDPKGFLDAIAFWDADHGLALGDPVEGRYTILTTDNGGATWTEIARDGMPPALPNEGAFAASGTCLVTWGDRHAWFGTGGGGSARVFRTEDRGRTWTAHDTPVRAGSPTSGIFGLTFRDADHGVIVGGAYDRPEQGGPIAATTEDGGRTWTLADGPRAFRSAAAFVDAMHVIAVGPSGSDLSTDGGRTWTPMGDEGFHAFGVVRSGAGWAVGEGGRIARFRGR